MYNWIVVIGGVFSFIAAMGIGANDVANAFATSIGSKALKMNQAIVLATVFETSGAILMGSHVTKTIRKGIADYECFENDPGSLMYGCMWVCFSVGAWLFIASKYEMPVSTTHSCVGGMIGMTVALKGINCVTWYEPKDSFPFVGGVSGIVLSWVISPIFSAMISSVLYATVRALILRHENSFNRTSFLFPIMIGSTVTLNSFFIIYKGAKGIGLDEMSLANASLISVGIGAVSGLFIIPLLPLFKKRTLARSNSGTFDPEEGNSGCAIMKCIAGDNMHEEIEQDNVVMEIHETAEKFDPNTEEYFKYLQVFTAICSAFSHGANDVANAIGPFVAIYMISKEGEVSETNEPNSNTSLMILSLGGLGISIGLIIYGYKIIKAIGLKICKITPSRGALIEMTSAIVIITGSRLEIPLSTTHCQVGATIGVASLENTRKCSGLNRSVLVKTFFGWIATLIVVGGTTALLTAQGAHAPEVGAHCPSFLNITS